MLWELVLLCYLPNGYFISFTLDLVLYKTAFGLYPRLAQKHSVQVWKQTKQITYRVDVNAGEQGQKHSNSPLELVNKVVV